MGHLYKAPGSNHRSHPYASEQMEALIAGNIWAELKQQFASTGKTT
jgi:hypothetical protein